MNKSLDTHFFLSFRESILDFANGEKPTRSIPCLQRQGPSSASASQTAPNLQMLFSPQTPQSPEPDPSSRPLLLASLSSGGAGFVALGPAKINPGASQLFLCWTQSSKQSLLRTVRVQEKLVSARVEHASGLDQTEQIFVV